MDWLYDLQCTNKPTTSAPQEDVLGHRSRFLRVSPGRKTLDLLQAKITYFKFLSIAHWEKNDKFTGRKMYFKRVVVVTEGDLFNHLTFQSVFSSEKEMTQS